MSMTPKQRQQLKGKAHSLRPIVFIGNNGLTDNVIMEIDRGLEDHELIKIRIQESDRNARKELFQKICEALFAYPIQLVGGIGVIYRVSKK
jgi:RNA-binding protein